MRRYASETGWPVTGDPWAGQPAAGSSAGGSAERWARPAPAAAAAAGAAEVPRPGLPEVLEAVVVGPGDVLGVRIAPSDTASMDQAAARILADVRKWRPELAGRVLVVAAEQVFAVRGDASERPG